MVSLNKDFSKRVLVATPYSDRHAYVINEWLSNTNSFSFPNFDIMIVDTSEKEDSYNWLESLAKKNKVKMIVKRHAWDKKSEYVLQMLSKVREEIKQYFIDNNYDYLFFLDSDILPRKDIIERLIETDRDHVGPPVSVFFEPDTRPCVLHSGEMYFPNSENKIGNKTGGLDYFSWDEIKKKKHLNKPFKCYAVGIGCCMIKRRVLEKCAFRTHPDFIAGEDVWYWAEANDKGFEFWCDPRIEVKHKNASWNGVDTKPAMAFGLFQMEGKMGLVYGNEQELADFCKNTLGKDEEVARTE